MPAVVERPPGPCTCPFGVEERRQPAAPAWVWPQRPGWFTRPAAGWGAPVLLDPVDFDPVPRWSDGQVALLEGPDGRLWLPVRDDDGRWALPEEASQ